MFNPSFFLKLLILSLFLNISHGQSLNCFSDKIRSNPSCKNGDSCYHSNPICQSSKGFCFFRIKNRIYCSDSRFSQNGSTLLNENVTNPKELIEKEVCIPCTQNVDNAKDNEGASKIISEALGLLRLRGDGAKDYICSEMYHKFMNGFVKKEFGRQNVSSSFKLNPKHYGYKPKWGEYYDKHKVSCDQKICHMLGNPPNDLNKSKKHGCSTDVGLPLVGKQCTKTEHRFAFFVEEGKLRSVPCNIYNLGGEKKVTSFSELKRLRGLNDQEALVLLKSSGVSEKEILSLIKREKGKKRKKSLTDLAKVIHRYVKTPVKKEEGKSIKESINNSINQAKKELFKLNEGLILKIERQCTELRRIRSRDENLYLLKYKNGNVVPSSMDLPKIVNGIINKECPKKDPKKDPKQTRFVDRNKEEKSLQDLHKLNEELFKVMDETGWASLTVYKGHIEASRQYAKALKGPIDAGIALLFESINKSCLYYGTVAGGTIGGKVMENVCDMITTPLRVYAQQYVDNAGRVNYNEVVKGILNEYSGQAVSIIFKLTPSLGKGGDKAKEELEKVLKESIKIQMKKTEYEILNLEKSCKDSLECTTRKIAKIIQDKMLEVPSMLVDLRAEEALELLKDYNKKNK